MAKSVYDITVETIDGTQKALGDYRGKVLLIVNVASKCGFTKQYEGLQQLYEAYAEQGLVVLGFPSNDFLKQEPGTNEEIATFCTRTFGVAFPMFAKVSVKGVGIHPLYGLLTDKAVQGEFGGAISWNFNKFLIGRDGRTIGRFGSRVTPQDKSLVDAIENALKVVPSDLE